MPLASGPDPSRNVHAASRDRPPFPDFCLDALDALPFGLWICDGNGELEHLSASFLELLGKGLAQCRQEGWAGHLPPEEREAALEKWGACLRDGRTWEHRYRVRDGDGRYRHVLSRGVPVRDGREAIRAWVGFNLDLTSLMEAVESAGKAEERRRKAQRLEFIGRLAGGVAHDFNNLLTAVNGYSELVLSLLGEEHPLGDHVKEIRRAGEKAATLTRQLLAFSRRQALAPKVLNLNAVIRDAWKSLGRFLGEGVEMEFRPDLSLARMKADPVQVEQVLFTVALNAKDAMPHGGRLIVETSNAELPPGEAASDSADPASPPRRGPFVLLTVQDCGDGMDEETLSHLFEPFYSTKGRAQGLGLPAVYGIVKQSGGYISVTSQKGIGSILRVYWPTVEEPSAAAAEPCQLRAEGRLILVAEDDEPLRNLVRETLEREGFSPCVAASGPEAMELAARLRGSPDLLLADVHLPGMGGLELAVRLQPSRPEMKILFMSGYADHPAVRQAILGTGQPFIGKPFSSGELAAKVRAVLALQTAP